MRRTLLLLCLTGAIFAMTAGSAGAAVQELDFRGPFVVLNANNQPAVSGPIAAFFADFRCTQGQRFAPLVVARQGGAIGAGGARPVTCTGDDQSAVVGVRKNTGSPNFSLLGATLNVEGVGATNLTNPPQLNDLAFDTSTVSPLPASELPLP